jgi:hypothetical protein
VPDVPADGDGVDLRQEVGLIDVGVSVGPGIIVEEDLLRLVFLIVEESADAFHVDDAVDLPSGQLAQPVLAAGANPLLVHAALGPEVPHPLRLGPLLQVGLLVGEGRSVYANLVGRHVCQRLLRHQ